MKTNQRTFPFVAIVVIIGLVLIAVILLTTNSKLKLSGSAVGTEEVSNALPQPTVTPTPIPTDTPIAPLSTPEPPTTICHSLDGITWQKLSVAASDLPLHRRHPYDIIPAMGDCPTAPTATFTPTPIPAAVIKISVTCALGNTEGRPQVLRYTISNTGGSMTSEGSYTLTRSGATIQTGTFTLASGQSKIVFDKKSITPNTRDTYVLTVSNVPQGPLTVTKDCF